MNKPESATGCTPARVEMLEVGMKLDHMMARWSRANVDADQTTFVVVEEPSIVDLVEIDHTSLDLDLDLDLGIQKQNLSHLLDN